MAKIDDDIEGGDDDEVGDGDDNEDGLGNGRDGMSEEELAKLEVSLVPIRLMLTKLSDHYLILKLSNQLSASSSCQYYQEFVDHYPSSMAHQA